MSSYVGKPASTELPLASHPLHPTTAIPSTLPQPFPPTLPQPFPPTPHHSLATFHPTQPPTPSPPPRSSPGPRPP
ncbi:hypothetical protein Pmani_030971 [Petrolisthes manimaculis]|uniref:Uncharacterized protein n=1 Tax=Petrolisthes manimaculis TaxID=1843537 RepID=A0AAE1NW90_9EUCA|nr:hypothetical protein Pmani_030971 [Petrolisthes manimaculis]